MRRSWRAQAASAAERGGGGAFPGIDREVNIIFRGHRAQENRRQQKLNDRQVLVATTSALAPYR
jgi:environmental stress-induced protein Ves